MRVARTSGSAIGVLLGCSLGLVHAQQPIDWAEAERTIVRLEPSDITTLSGGVRAELSRRQCAIPQPYGTNSGNNVIGGSFTAPDRTDVAVLCSRQGVSAILVFEGGEAESVHELAPLSNLTFVEVVGPGQFGFSREIRATAPAMIRAQAEIHAGPVPPVLDHDGISDAYGEKASVIWYWETDRWRQLQGSD